MAIKIVGVEGLSVAQVQQEVGQGARFVIFDWVLSLLVITMTNKSDIHFIRPGQNAVVKGLPYTLLSFFLGWWGIPWGLIRTPIAIVTNLSGGRDVTASVMSSLAGPRPAAPPPPAAMQPPMTGAPIKPR